MPSSELWKFEYKVKDFPDSARINFMENMKTQLVASVKDSVSNLTRGILDVEGKIDGNTISIKVVDLRSRDTVRREKEDAYLNISNGDSLFNIVTEDEFREKVQESAKKAHESTLRLILEAKNIFSK